DFTNTLLVVTTGVGTRQIPDQFTGFGFVKKESADDAVTPALRQELERKLPPEFLHRLDDLVVFRPLSANDLRTILSLELAKLARRLGQQLGTEGVQFDLNDEVTDFLLGKCPVPGSGAWGLRQAIAQELEVPLAEELLKGTLAGAATIEVSVRDVDGEKR